MEISIKAKEEKGIVVIKMLIRHPMETGQRKNDDGNIVPANFINEVLITSLKGDILLKANLGASTAKDPNFFFKTKSLKKGDKFNISWKTNLGVEKKQQGLVE